MSSFKEVLQNIPGNLSSLYKDAKNYLSKLKPFFKNGKINFEQVILANTTLGILELENGRINDAILRFKFARFLSNDKNLNNYHLAWCYFFKKDFTKAMKYLGEGASLLKQVLMGEPVETSETSMFLKALYDLSPQKIESVYNLDNNFESKYFVEFIKENTENIINALHIGTKGGRLGQELKATALKEFTLDGVEVSQKMCRVARNKKALNGFAYQGIKLCNDYIDVKVDSKYDTIILGNILSLYKDFTLLLKPLKGKSLLFYLQLSEKADIEQDKGEYMYKFSREKIEDYLRQVGYKITSSKIVTFKGSKFWMLSSC